VFSFDSSPRSVLENQAYYPLTRTIMTVRREVWQSPSETGAWRREEGRQT